MELDNLSNGLIVDKDCCSHVQLVVDQVAQFLRLILLHLHQDLFHQVQKRYISKHNLGKYREISKKLSLLVDPVHQGLAEPPSPPPPLMNPVQKK